MPPRPHDINYTTYDVRRAQDIIHTGTSQCNVMVISSDTLDTTVPESQRFRYAKVLGIYHANVVYTGSGMRDYQPRRLDFLWVRWYEHVDQPAGWAERRLDQVYFPPVAGPESFGFLDPAYALRACHIIPALAQGKVHSDRIGISRCAEDHQDWRRFYIDRYCTSL